MTEVETTCTYTTATAMIREIEKGLTDQQMAEMLEERMVADTQMDGRIDDIENTVLLLTNALEMAFKRIAALQEQINAK